jgi:glycosyltransferase involved in cell wall biosynthesis
VHVHFANAASSIAMLYAYFAEPEGATWSLTMHGPAEFDHVGFFRLAEKVQRARFVVCISDYARSQLMKLTPPDQWRKLIVVHCGVDPTVFNPGPDRHRESGDRLTVLCVGRLAPDKGYGILFDALASLPADDARRIEVVIVGDGPQREELQRRAAELPGCQVTFAGAAGQDRLLPLYGQADIFCLPSLAEGLPVVLMEAMAMGLPVIAPGIMGIPELVTDRTTGLTVSPGRADLLAGALRELLDDEGLRRTLGEAGRERVLADYDVRRSAELLNDLYRDLVPGPVAR